MMILDFLWDFADDQGSSIGFEWEKWVESICYSEVHGREAQGCASFELEEDFGSPIGELCYERKAYQNQGFI